jgi:Rrf2 family protein
MLTAKGKYGLKALVHLAHLEAGDTAQSADIAEANNISKKFLDAILADLRRSGFVETKKGRGGGYRLAQKAKDIRIGNVIRALDGPLAPIACASRTAYRACDDCKSRQKCAVRIVMTEVRDAMSKVLDRTTLADMATGQ